MQFQKIKTCHESLKIYDDDQRNNKKNNSTWMVQVWQGRVSPELW